MSTKQKPLSPQQALNNFKLICNGSHLDYSAVDAHAIASLCVQKGIQGDDEHPGHEKALVEALTMLLSEFNSRTALVETCDLDPDELKAIRLSEKVLAACSRKPGY